MLSWEKSPSLFLTKEAHKNRAPFWSSIFVGLFFKGETTSVFLMQTHTCGVAPEKKLYFDRPLLQKRLPTLQDGKSGFLLWETALLQKRPSNVCVCVCVCVRARARACVCVYVCVRTRACVYTHWYTDPDVFTYICIYRICMYIYIQRPTLWLTTTHCHTLPHTATHCNTLRHTATHCNTLQ